MARSDFLHTLESRGFIHQCTDMDALDESFKQGTVTGYIGFDATAQSLHVGSLLQIMLLRHLQKTGHKPIILVGGGTTKIGDPSGRDASRQLLDDTQIAQNIAGISKVFSKYLNIGKNANDAILVNNADWLLGLNYVDFLRDYGRHFSVTRMLSFDSVKLRLDREQPLSFLEFNYMIFQAYDFVELNRRYNCTLQMGGSDQWGNIVNGVELTRRTLSKSTFGLTSPLITTSDGGKMGKTANGAVWLNEDFLKPYDFWQFWRNTTDADVGRFLKLFTEMSLDEIAKLERLQGSEINEAKIILADAVTTLAHGPDCLHDIHATVKGLFGGNNAAAGQNAAIDRLNITRDSIESGITVFEAMVKGGLASSNGEARRLIKGNGVKLNNEAVTDEVLRLNLDDFSDEHDNHQLCALLSVGKKRHLLMVLC